MQDSTDSNTLLMMKSSQGRAFDDAQAKESLQRSKHDYFANRHNLRAYESKLQQRITKLKQQGTQCTGTIQDRQLLPVPASKRMNQTKWNKQGKQHRIERNDLESSMHENQSHDSSSCYGDENSRSSNDEPMWGYFVDCTTIY